MENSKIILDHELEIILDENNPPFDNYHAFNQNFVGLKILADAVRQQELLEIKKDPRATEGTLRFLCPVNPIVPCAFSWFSVTIVNYLRLVALVELMTKNNWKSSDLTNNDNRKVIRTHCREYVEKVIPEIYLWRNKVAAHFAATDPFRDDTLGTLEQSIMDPIAYNYPYYYAGLFQWNTAGSSSELASWSLTETYERLRKRYWPSMSLASIPNSVDQSKTINMFRYV